MKTADEALKAATKAAYEQVWQAPHVAHMSELEETGVAQVDGAVDFGSLIVAALRALDAAGWVCVPKDMPHALWPQMLESAPKLVEVKP